MQTDFFHRGHNALCDHIAAHDAAEDVHKDAFDVRVRGNDLERLGHLLGGGTAAHIKEVCRLGAVKLDDVHRGHREACTVHHAANLAIKRDVVQVELGGSEFLGVFFRLITQRGDVGMTVNGVSVEADLGVEDFQIALVGDDQRVDLKHLHVFFHEGFEQHSHQANTLLDLGAFQTECEGNAASMVGLVAGGWIDSEGQDFLRSLCSDFFDVHSALG